MHSVVRTTFFVLPALLLLPIGVQAQSQSFNNPITFTDIQDLLAAVLNVAIVISIPIVVFFLIYSGFLYVTARGNAEQVQQAGRSLLYGIIGGVIIVGSVAILAIMENLVSNFTP